MARFLEAIHLTKRTDRPVDWVAAARAIEALDLRTLYTGDEFFPAFLEDHPDVPDPPAALGVYWMLRDARASLVGGAALVRGAIESESPAVMILETGPWTTYLVLTSGGVDGGLPFSLASIAEAGVAQAAGFADSGDYTEVPLGKRKLPFTSEHMLAVRGAQAWLLAEDAARPMLSDLARVGTDQWPSTWLRPLQRSAAATEPFEAEREFFRFLACTLAILLALVERAGIDEDAWISEMVELIDTQARPGAAAASEVAGDMLAHTTGFFADALAALDRDPEDEILTNLTAWTGVPAEESLAIELCTGVLLPGILAVAAIADDELADIRPFVTERPVTERPVESTVPSDLVDYVSWCAFVSLDCDAVEVAIDECLEIEQQGLRADLAVLREALSGERFGYTTRFSAHEISYLVGMGEDRDGWTLVPSLRRLGASGVLPKAGAVAWG